jgi:hypothetical protein
MTYSPPHYWGKDPQAPFRVPQRTKTLSKRFLLFPKAGNHFNKASKLMETNMISVTIANNLKT